MPLLEFFFKYAILTFFCTPLRSFALGLTCMAMPIIASRNCGSPLLGKGVCRRKKALANLSLAVKELAEEVLGG